MTTGAISAGYFKSDRKSLTPEQLTFQDVLMAQVHSRYGHSEIIDDPNSAWITHRLLQELKTEKFEEPDVEHIQVSVSNEHWSVTAFVGGLITFDNIDLLEGMPSELPEEMFLRDIPDDELIEIWQATVSCDEANLLAYPWRSRDELSND